MASSSASEPDRDPARSRPADAQRHQRSERRLGPATASRSRVRAGLTRIVVAALIVGIVMSCTRSAIDDQEIEDQLSHQVVECREAIDVVTEPGDYYTAHGSGDGFIALPASQMQLGRWGPEGSSYEDYRFAKFGLLVRRFRQVSLEIARAPGDAFFQSGGRAFASGDALRLGPCDTDGPACVIEPTESLSVGPCGTGRGEWVVWAGGIWVNEPGCVEVIASSDDEEIPVPLAVGASCDGTAAK